MVICQSCNSENPDDAKFCNKCGSPLIVPTPHGVQNPPQSSVPNKPVGYQTLIVRSQKDRTVALILEILPGLFGLLGFGWIYAGNTSTGILWLVGFIIWSIIAATISVITGGIGALCWLPLSIALITISANSLNKYTKEHPELFGT